MVHWSLLLVSFSLGFGTGYLVLYLLGKALAGIEDAIERGARYSTPFR